MAVMEAVRTDRWDRLPGSITAPLHARLAIAAHFASGVKCPEAVMAAQE